MGAKDFGGLPEQVEAELAPRSPALCAASSRWGTMLAVGCKNGDVVIYDMLTRGVACTLLYSDLQQGGAASVTSLAWTRLGKVLLSGYANGVVCRWDMTQCTPAQVSTLDREVATLSLPDEATAAALVAFSKGPPVLLAPDGTVRDVPAIGGGRILGAMHRKGHLVVVCSDKGLLCVMDTASLKVVDVIQVTGSTISVAMSRQGTSVIVATAASVRCIPIAPITQAHTAAGLDVDALPDIAANLKGGGGSHLSVSEGGPPPILAAGADFRDPINNNRWSCAAMSRDGEYVCGGAAGKEQHIVRVWEAHGASLAVVLEGPPVGLRSVAWHPDPSRHLLVSITMTGTVYIWAYIISQNWDVYAPGFTSLTGNVEYVESETEFDLNSPAADAQAQPPATPTSIDVATVVKGEHALYDSDTEEDLRDGLFMVPCHLSSFTQAPDAAPSSGVGGAHPGAAMGDEQPGALRGKSDLVPLEEGGRGMRAKRPRVAH